MLGETEIENFGVAAISDEDVGGLDVAMNDAFRVGGVERVGDLDAEIEEQFQIEGAAVDAMLQGFAIEAFHCDVGVTVGFADIVNRADVGMIERGGSAGFAAEAFERLRVFSEIVGKKFQGDVAAEVCVFGFVNDAHSAAAEPFDDAVVREGLANHRIGGRHVRDMLGWAGRQVNERDFARIRLATDSANTSIWRADGERSIFTYVFLSCNIATVKPLELLGQALSRDGSVLKLVRRSEEYIILANGKSLMSSRMHGSEEALATFACQKARMLEQPSVLIGGLGMGFTLRATLDLLPGDATVVVAELVPAVVEWNRGPLGPLAGEPLGDPRVRVEIDDVAVILESRRGQFDAVLLDVDNGPSGLAPRTMIGFTMIAELPLPSRRSRWTEYWPSGRHERIGGSSNACATGGSA